MTSRRTKTRQNMRSKWPVLARSWLRRSTHACRPIVDAQHDTCLLRMRSIPAVRRTFWCSSRSGGSSPLAIARKYLINNNVYNIRSLQNDYRLIITSTVTGDLKAGPLLSFHCWFGRNTWVRHSSLWSDVSKPSLMAALSYLLQRQLDVAFC